MEPTLPIILIADNPMLDLAAKAGLLLLAGLLAYAVARLVLVRAAHAFARRTRGAFDDMLVQEGVFARAALLATALVFYWGLKFTPTLKERVDDAVFAYTAVAVILVLIRMVDALVRLYDSMDVAARRPIKGYAQLLKLFVYILGAVSVVAILLGKSPWGLLSGIGAMTAVLMLIFRDTLLSLVASIQIGANNLLRPGDWIEMPAMNADGEVVDIALNTVKVRNWDLTITAIPTFKFLDTPFKNWQSMIESRARRMQRAIMIDQSSVCFADDTLLDRLSRVQRLAPHIAQRLEAIRQADEGNETDPGSPLNGHRLTNLGLFRYYAQDYVMSHPGVRQDMPLLVHQLEPDAAKGLPMEVYCFTNETGWNLHEDTAAEIISHLLAALPRFGLRAYQRNALIDGRTAGEIAPRT